MLQAGILAGCLAPNVVELIHDDFELCDVFGSAGFEDVPLPFFLKVIKWVKFFWNGLGFFLAKLRFNFVFLDSDDCTWTRSKLLSKIFFREHDFLVQLE